MVLDALTVEDGVVEAVPVVLPAGPAGGTLGVLLLVSVPL